MYSHDETVEGQQTTMHPQMARYHQLTVNQLSMNRAMPQKKLAHIVHLRADHKIKHYWPRQ